MIRTPNWFLGDSQIRSLVALETRDTHLRHDLQDTWNPVSLAQIIHWIIKLLGNLEMDKSYKYASRLWDLQFGRIPPLHFHHLRSSQVMRSEVDACLPMLEGSTCFHFIPYTFVGVMVYFCRSHLSQSPTQSTEVMVTSTWKQNQIRDRVP